MPEAHTTIAMIATVMLLWGLSVALRGLGGRLPRLRRRARKNAPASAARPVSVPVTIFGALVAAGSAPVFWTAGQVYRWVRSVDPMVAPFTIWTGVALGCVAFGAGLVAAGFRGDRPKGRKRCPGCWYDMSGAPGHTCPECGREMEDAADLLRPRRNRRMIAAGVALVLLAIVPYYTPRVQRGGWVAAVPTTALILGLPWWPDSAITGGAGNTDDWSLLSRIEEEAVHAWQLRLLRSRGARTAINPSDAKRMIRLGSELDDAAMLHSAAKYLVAAAARPGVDDVQRFELLSESARALMYLAWDDVDTGQIVNPHVEAIAHMLSLDDGYLAIPAVQVLYHATEAGPAIEPLIAVLRSPAKWQLPEQDSRWTVYQTPHYHAAVALLTAAPSDAGASEVLLDSLGGRLSREHQHAALWALWVRDTRFEGLAAALACRLADPDTARVAAVALVRRREDAAEVAPPLLAALLASEDPPEPLVHAAAHLVDAGINPNACFAPLLDHPSREVRTAIAGAVAEQYQRDDSWDDARVLAILRELRAKPGPGADLRRLDDAIETLQRRLPSPP